MIFSAVVGPTPGSVHSVSRSAVLIDTRVSVLFSGQYKDCKLVTIPGDTHCYDHHLELVTEAVKDFMLEQMHKCVK